MHDLHAMAPLHRILTADPSPVAAMQLRLLAPGSPASGGVGEPSVLLMAGGGGGMVQAWLLAATRTPVLRACWQHQVAGPLLAVDLDSEGERLISIGQSDVQGAQEVDGYFAAHLPEVEVRDVHAWRSLLEQERIDARPAEKLLSAEIFCADGVSTGGSAETCLLLCRASGILQQCSLRSTAEPFVSGTDALSSEASVSEPAATGIAVSDAFIRSASLAAHERTESTGIDIVPEDAPTVNAPPAHSGDTLPRPVQAERLEAANASSCAAPLHTDTDAEPRQSIPIAFACGGAQTRQLPLEPADKKQRANCADDIRAELSERLPGRFDNPLRVLSLLQVSTSLGFCVLCTQQPSQHFTPTPPHTHTLVRTVKHTRTPCAFAGFLG